MWLYPSFLASFIIAGKQPQQKPHSFLPASAQFTGGKSLHTKAPSPDGEITQGMNIQFHTLLNLSPPPPAKAAELFLYFSFLMSAFQQQIF